MCLEILRLPSVFLQDPSHQMLFRIISHFKTVIYMTTVTSGSNLFLTSIVFKLLDLTFAMFWNSQTYQTETNQRNIQTVIQSFFSKTN